MSKLSSIRRRLLTDQILLILLLGGGIMATTFVGARRAVEALSRAVVTRADSAARVVTDPLDRTLPILHRRPPRHDRFTTYSAGQAPLLLYRAATGETSSMNADAPPMGLLPALPVLPSPAIAMQPGDVYAVLSDGFFEAVDSAGMEFGKDRVGEIIHQHRRAGATEILAAIRAALREFTGDAPLDDDRTAVIVKRT